jgi:hypothetical protein
MLKIITRRHPESQVRGGTAEMLPGFFVQEGGGKITKDTDCRLPTHKYLSYAFLLR